jgi:hypothetical protein
MRFWAKPTQTKPKRHLMRRTFAMSGVLAIVATLVLPIFLLTASAAPTAINLPARGTRADLGNIGRTQAIPFSTCIASFGAMTREAGMLQTYFSNKTNEFLGQSDQVIDRSENVTYLGTYIGPQNQLPQGSNTLSQGQFDFLLNRAAMGQDQLPVIQFASAAAGAQPINGPFNTGGDCNTLVALPVSQTEWRMYQIERSNAGVGSTNPYWYGTFRNPRPDGTSGTTFSFEFYGVMPGNNNTLLERRTVDFNVFGLPTWGGTGGGGSNAGTLNVEWVNASELKVTSGERQGEVYRMGRWQAHNGHSYYFLHSGANAERAGLQDSNGRMCENDPGPMPIGSNCVGGTTNCVPFIEVRKAINFSRESPQNFQPWLRSLGSGPAQLFDYNNANECRSDKFWNVTLSNPGNNSEVWFYYSKAADGFQIVFTSGDGNEAPYVATYSKDPSGLYIGGTGSCDGRITLADPGAVNLERFYVNWQLLNMQAGTCASPVPYTTVNVQVIGGAAGDTKFQELAGIVADTGDDIGDGSRAADLVCDFSFNPLTWIMCPIIAGAQAGVEQLDNGINSMLAINVDRYFDENCNDPKTCSGGGFYKAWNGVRILATAVIVIAALVMIISQASGWDLMDAHTFRKMLPRMVVAVIAIPVSWELAKEAVRFSEVIGIGVRDIIYSPFAGAGGLHIGGGTSTALALVGGAALLTLGIFAMLSFVVSAFLAALVAFAVLVFRQAAIIFLVILAPFAIACYIMPSTQKAWKFWSGSFMAMLLMFPIIVGMIAMGRVFAFVTHRADPNNLFFQLVALVAYFLPYFMITTAFKLAGGAISAVSGMLGNATGGLANGLRNFRSNAARANIGKMRSGDRFKGSNRLARAFNTTSQGIGFGARGHFGLGNRGASMRDIAGRQAATKAGKTDEMQELQFDDDAVAAMYLSAGQSARRSQRELTRLHQDAAGNWNSGWNEQRVQRAVSMAQAVGINKSNAIAAGSLAGDNKFRSMGFGQDASDAIASTNALLAGGRLDGAGNYAGGNTQMFENLEGGIRWHGRTHGAAHVADRTLAGSWDRTDMSELRTATPQAKEAFLQDITGRLGHADHGVRQRAAIQALEMHSLLSHGTDAGSQAVLNQAEDLWGFNDTERLANPFEEFLTQRYLGSAAPPPGSAGDGVILRSRARTWDSQTESELARMRAGTGAPGAP